MLGLLKRIIQTIEEYEQEKEAQIKNLEGKVDALVKERQLVVKHLKEGNIELLKTYFNI